MKVSSLSKVVFRSGLFAIMLVAVASLSVTQARAQSVLLTGDTQINSAATSTNYGTSTSLAVNSTNSVLLHSISRTSSRRILQPLK